MKYKHFMESISILCLFLILRSFYFVVISISILH